MAKTQGRDLRRALAERVTRQLAGRGISRAAVDDAVGRVVAALDAPADRPAAVEGAGNGGQLLAALSARSTPDLASRVRRELEREGLVVDALGHGSAGQHTVVTLRLPASARPALERLAERSRLSLSLFAPAESGVPDSGLA
jgi:hypothetical protein